MSQQMKDIIWGVAISLVMCAVVLVWWFNSPMYREVKAYNEITTQEFLANTYYFGDYGPIEINRQELMDKYGITDDEVNPKSLLVDVDPTVTQSIDVSVVKNNPVYSGVGVACFLGSLGLIILYDLLRKRRAKACDE